MAGLSTFSQRSQIFIPTRTSNLAMRIPISADMPQAGDIVLAAFPFTDLSGTKRRPRVVLAAAESAGDFVFAFITTEPSARFPRFGVAVDPTHPSWKQARLKAPSVVRTDKLCTLNTSVIVGRLGVLPPDLLELVRSHLKRLFSL
jgi:mRNA interferase MazF